MKQSEMMTVTLPSDREIEMTRVFDAPREKVFQAYTRPELLKRWLGVIEGNVLEQCEVDLHEGGAYRYVWREADGTTMGMGGTFREIVEPERIVATERFDEPWYEGEALDTIEFDEEGGKTRLTVTVRYDSNAVRDTVLETPMTEGLSASYDKLAELLAARER